MKPLLFAVAAFIAANASGARMSNSEPIRYTIRFTAPQTHYMEIEASYPTRGAKAVEVMMPVWSPGSYLVREYSRNVEDVKASSTSNKSLAIEKTRKNRWRIASNGAERVTFNYRVYGREMSVRTNYIDADFAMIHGPATFIAPIDQLESPYEVTIELPKNWSRAISGLAESSPNHFHASDFDVLADSPIAAGNPAVHEFEVDGKPHYLVNIGGESFWDGPRAARDVKKIVEENKKLWGSLPYDKYVFFNFIVEAGGGLEHLNSTVIMARRYTMRTRKSYLTWLEVMSHEHFHVWNVKRMRPVELGPFDYEKEVYTENLWISEGFTDYYDKLTIHRAGLATRDEFFEEYSKNIETLQTTPGRFVQSAEMASYDAWIKQYRPDENSINTAISYYTKGSVIAFLLDGRIRKVTNNGKSLDDVMRLAYQRYSGTRGFTSADFVDVVGDVAGSDTASWLDRASSNASDLDYAEALAWLGLEFKKEEKAPSLTTTTTQPDKGEQNAPEVTTVEPRREKEPKGWLGATIRNDGGRVIVATVRRGTPAFDAGLNVEDEIVAVDGFRTAADQYEARFDSYRPGDKVVLTIARRLKLRDLHATLGTEPPKVWKLQVVKTPTDAQKSALERWLM